MAGPPQGEKDLIVFPFHGNYGFVLNSKDQGDQGMTDELLDGEGPTTLADTLLVWIRHTHRGVINNVLPGVIGRYHNTSFRDVDVFNLSLGIATVGISHLLLLHTLQEAFEAAFKCDGHQHLDIVDVDGTPGKELEVYLTGKITSLPWVREVFRCKTRDDVLQPDQAIGWNECLGFFELWKVP